MVRNAGGGGWVGGWVGMPKRYEGVGVFMLALRNVNFLWLTVFVESNFIRIHVIFLFDTLINLCL